MRVYNERRVRFVTCFGRLILVILISALFFNFKEKSVKNIYLATLLCKPSFPKKNHIEQESQ